MAIPLLLKKMISAGGNGFEREYPRWTKPKQFPEPYIPNYVLEMIDNQSPNIAKLVIEDRVDIVCEKGPYQRCSERYLIDFFGDVRIKLQYPLDMIDYHMGRYESFHRVLSPQSFNQYFDVDRERVERFGILMNELKDERPVLCGKQFLPARFMLIHEKSHAVLEIRRVKKNLNG
jgi:hypothetical protein